MKIRFAPVVLTMLGLLHGAHAARAADAADVAKGLAAFRVGAFAEAYEAWSNAADAGDARAARFLGVMNDTGEGVRQDPAGALRWYRRAAELGDPVGMFNVGVSYDAGTDAPADKAEAARWYGRAAARHHGRAEYNLALMYQSGDGVRRDDAKARRLFEAAARDGIAAAASHLAHPQKIVERAPAGGDDAAFLQAQQALLSRDSHEAAMAVGLFRQAAAQPGVAAAMAQYDLGWCYENGIGVKPDRQQAYALYIRVAAETDDHVLRQLAEAGAEALRGATPAFKPSPAMH